MLVTSRRAQKQHNQMVIQGKHYVTGTMVARLLRELFRVAVQKTETILAIAYDWSIYQQKRITNNCL